MPFSSVLWSNENEQATSPMDMYAKLDKTFHFKLDAATSQANPLGAPKFYTKEDNGLLKPWEQMTFVNPPFSEVRLVKKGRRKRMIRTNVLPKWVTKAYAEGELGHNSVMLVSSRTGTRWFQDMCFTHAKMICFVRGRLKFAESENSAPFDSVLLMFADRLPSKKEYGAFENFGKTFMLEKRSMVEVVDNGKMRRRQPELHQQNTSG